MADLPFVAQPAGGDDLVDTAAAEAARRWALPDPALIRHGMNGVYAAGDDVVLRVCRPSADAAVALELARRLADNGISVARPVRDEVVAVGDLSVLAFERLRPSGAPIDWRGVGAAIARLHSLPPDVVPAGYPAPRGLSFPWWDFDVLLADTAADVRSVDAAAFDGLATAVERHRAVVDAARVAPDSDRVMCHGDVHPGNVVQTAGGPVLVDWDLLCREPRGWDHGALINWVERWGGEPALYERFAEGYGADLRTEPFAAAAAELRLVAATLMRVRAGRNDAGAREEASRRLRYWAGDPDAPLWRAA